MAKLREEKEVAVQVKKEITQLTSKGWKKTLRRNLEKGIR